MHQKKLRQIFAFRRVETLCPHPYLLQDSSIKTPPTMDNPISPPPLAILVHYDDPQSPSVKPPFLFSAQNDLCTILELATKHSHHGQVDGLRLLPSSGLTSSLSWATKGAIAEQSLWDSVVLFIRRSKEPLVFSRRMKQRYILTLLQYLLAK